MSITATISLNEPTASLNKLEMFGNWILVDGYWNDNGIWIDEAIMGRNYYTDPVAITLISITEITATGET